MYGKLDPSFFSDWLADVADKAIYGAIMSADPYSVEDPATTEVSGPYYTRALTSWVTAGYNAITNATVLNWANLVVGTSIFAVSFFDAPANGQLRATLYLDTPTPITAAGNYQVPGNGIVLGFDLI